MNAKDKRSLKQKIRSLYNHNTVSAMNSKYIIPPISMHYILRFNNSDFKEYHVTAFM